MFIAPTGRTLERSRSRLAALSAALLATALLLAAASAGEAAEIRVAGIRHSTTAERTRIVLDLSGPASFRKSESADPPAAIIELDRTSFDPGVISFPLGDGRVRGLRLLPPDRLPAQVVVDLAGRRSTKVFPVPAGDGKPDRLVIDVFGAPSAESVAGAPEAEPVPAPAPGPPAPPSPAPQVQSPAAPPAAAPAAPPAAAPAAPPAAAPTQGAGATPQSAARAAAPPPDTARSQGATAALIPPPAPAAAKKTSPAAVKGNEPARLAPARPRVVVIDPGHGGHDPGAKGPGGVREKDICLAIAKAVAADLERRPGYRAVLTRDKDVFLNLRQRTRIAAEQKADLFVSIHANASRSKSARGTEVYFLSLRGASDEAASEVAMRENAADHVAGVPAESQNEIEDILVDLLRASALERSSELAVTVIEHLRADANLELRGVKQAGFDVLKTAGMPSILIETAFISHPKEAKLLKSRDFQRRFAGLVANAVDVYLDRALVTDTPVPPGRPVESPAAASPAASTRAAGS